MTRASNRGTVFIETRKISSKKFLKSVFHKFSLAILEYLFPYIQEINISLSAERCFVLHGIISVAQR